METITKIAGVLAVGLLLGLLLALLYAVPVYFLWNWLLPELFGLKAITLGQALGLTLLCSLLFKSTSSSSKSK